MGLKNRERDRKQRDSLREREREMRNKFLQVSQNPTTMSDEGE
jgi:hypothetical protein